MRYYISEIISGIANTTVYGNGITSTETEKKILKGVYVTTSAIANNKVELWLERERTHQVDDSLFPRATDAFRLFIDVDKEIDIGKTYKAALRSGGTGTNIIVTYVYEIKE